MSYDFSGLITYLNIKLIGYIGCINHILIYRRGTDNIYKSDKEKYNEVCWGWWWSQSIGVTITYYIDFVYTLAQLCYTISLALAGTAKKFNLEWKAFE